MGIAVSVGICAYNEERRIGAALDSLGAQVLPDDFVVEEILVVASGCTDGTELAVQSRADRDSRIRLLREPERRGKTAAINTILEEYQGDVLVLLNADARPFPGSLAKLLEPFRSDRAMIACGAPVPDLRAVDLRGLLADLTWGLHNRTLETLSSLGMDNHCCDELMAFRRGFVTSLPPGTVNDGAYLAALAATRNLGVLFCPDAAVGIEIPRDIAGLLRQRRRNIFSHRQIESLLDRRSRTFRELSRDRPDLALRILAGELGWSLKRFTAFLILALPFEAVANVLVAYDRARHRPYQHTWPIVE